MSEHTPGPWSVLPPRPDNEGFIIQPIQSDNTKGIIAKVCGGNILSEPRANAQLIAAAPDLLEELERVQNGLYNLCEMGLVRPKEETLEVARRIGRLIAKAKGR